MEKPAETRTPIPDPIGPPLLSRLSHSPVPTPWQGGFPWPGQPWAGACLRVGEPGFHRQTLQPPHLEGPTCASVPLSTTLQPPEATTPLPVSESDCSRALTGVESYRICPSVTGLFH